MAGTGLVGKYIKEEEHGTVTLYCWSDKNRCDDIDISGDITSVTLNLPCIYFSDFINKSFPQVTELCIASNVRNIIMPNYVFPNVRKVTSYSKDYMSGSMLVDTEGTLINAFCIREDETVDLSGVEKIRANAFDDCESTNIINTEGVKTCSGHAFDKSAFARQEYVNGVKMAGTIIVEIDSEAEVVEIPGYATCIQDIYRVGKNKHIIFGANSNGEKTFIFLPDALPEKVTIKTNQALEFTEITLLITTSGVKYLNICQQEEENRYKSVDGIIYKNNMLIACPTDRDDDVVIPDGIKYITSRAFEWCKIKSVTIPGSVKSIGYYSFNQCDNLERVDFLDCKDELEMSEFAFYKCSSLKHIEIPERIKTIKQGAFMHSGLRSISFQEGVENIDASAFMCGNLKEVRLPASLKEVGKDSFFHTKTIHVEGNLPKNIASAVVSAARFEQSYNAYDEDDDSEHVITIQTKTGNIFLPSKIGVRELSIVNDCLNAHPDNVSQEYRNHLYKYGSSFIENEDVAICIYKDTGDDTAREFLESRKRHIALRMTVGYKDEKRIIDIVKLGIFDMDCLKMILEYAQEKGRTTIAAYVLGEMQKAGVEELDAGVENLGC